MEDSKTIKCVCEICKKEYEKPEYFLIMKDKNIFFRWSLRFCDPCRHEKEVKALDALPQILEALSNSNEKNGI